MNRIGILIMGGFSTLWFVWGLTAISPINGLWLLLPFAISGALMAAAMRLPDTSSEADRRRRGKVVGVASAIEGIAILIATNVLINLGYSGYVVVATLAIVGLHFIPLAYYLRAPVYYGTSAAMTGLALFGCTIAPDTTRLLVLGVGAAVLLWLTCLAGFTRKKQVLLF